MIAIVETSTSFREQIVLPMYQSATVKRILADTQYEPSSKTRIIYHLMGSN
jgi:hypothetical protein